MSELSQPTSVRSLAGARAKTWQRLLPLLIAAACFAYLYNSINHAAAREGSGLLPYLAKSFEAVNWFSWLGLTIPYCFFYLILDSLMIWTVINWFNTKVRYADILPIRASAYILSMVNEQVSKGAIAFYLNRRAGIPGWEVGSSMIFVTICEFYSLFLWATLGVLLGWDHFQPVFHVIPWIALSATVFFVLLQMFFSGRIGSSSALRERPVFRALRLAKVWHYLLVIAIRAPLVLAAVVVYTLALRLFGGSVTFLEMLGYLPVVLLGATLPGPMHSVAILFWVLLFPDKPGQMTAFGFVMHNFFMLFNATVGLLFLRRATREIFG